MNTENLYMLLIALAVCAISFYLLIRDKKINRELAVYSGLMVLMVIGIAVALQIIYKDNLFLFNVKRVCLTAVMWPVVYIDFKEYKIPNKYIILGLICRAAIIPFEFIYGTGDVVNTLISEAAAALALAASAFLCRLCIKNSVGAGDIKLFIVMGLMLGMDGIWSAVFMTLVISFFIALFLLISKRKSRKDTIPFGPAIVMGTYISIFLTGM